MIKRVRVGNCPSCKKDTRITAAKSHNLLNSLAPHTCCENCFVVFYNSDVESKLVERDTHYGISSANS